MTSTTTSDPAAIEREIRLTQENMSSTVEKIGDQLSIKNVFNALLDKADSQNIDARMVLDGARRNPIALGLIAAGAIWLISDKDSKIPTLRMPGGKSSGPSDNFDSDQQDYTTHMSVVEQYEGEDEADYDRRRDLARSSFFNVEKNDGEDDTGFRARLDALSEKFSEKRHAWAQGSVNAGALAKDKAKAVTGKAQDLYTGNPLMAGVFAAAVGAAFGSALPVTRQERSTLGPLGTKVHNAVDERKQEVVAQVREKKDVLLEKADQAIRQPEPVA